MNAFQGLVAIGQWAQQHQDLLLYGTGGALALMLGGTVLRQARRPAQTTHGSARWATSSEIKTAGLTVPHGVVLGHYGKHLLHDDSETHVLLLAPTRSGKGIGPIGCTLLTWHASALVFEPKDGENYAFSHAWRAAQGQRVEQFTPRRSPHACINVEDMLRLGTPQEFDDAWAIAGSLLAPDKMVHENRTSQHFRLLATMLLTGAQLHLAYTFPPASLGKLWWMLTQRYRGTTPGTALLTCLTAMQTTAHTSHGVHRVITELATAIQTISGDRELGSIWSTAISPLLPYADYLTQRSTDTSTVDLEDLQYGSSPMSLYLVAPKPSALTRLAPLYRVISDMALHRLQEHAPRTASHRLLVVADEAPAYGYSLLLDKGAAETAGYGIKLLIVGQDIPQIEDTFGRNNSLWGNTHVKIFYAPDSDSTARRLSERLGQATVEQPVLSQHQGLIKQGSTAYQQVGRSLLTADELQAMDPEAALIYKTNMRPILAKKVNYLRDPAYRTRSRAA